MTRVVAALLGCVSAKITTLTVQEALRTLHVSTLAPPQVAAQLLTDPALFTLAGPSGAAETQRLKVTPHGARVAAEFRAHRESLTRFRTAQRTVLRCCAAHPATHYLEPADILADPLSWLYGTQFLITELRRAALALSEIGLLLVTGPSPVVQLSARGELCVEHYDSDPRRMSACS